MEGDFGALERKKSKFLKKFSSLDSSSSPSFLSLSLSLSLSYNDEYTRADDNKRKNTPAECEESLQQSKRFLPRGGARTPLRAIETRGLLRAIFFFFGLSREEGTTRGGGEERKPKTKFRHKRGKKPIFFKRENWKGHGTLQKTSHTFLPRGSV